MTAITTPSQVNTENNLGNNNSDPSILQENITKVKSGSDEDIENSLAINTKIEQIKEKLEQIKDYLALLEETRMPIAE